MHSWNGWFDIHSSNVLLLKCWIVILILAISQILVEFKIIWDNVAFHYFLSFWVMIWEMSLSFNIREEKYLISRKYHLLDQLTPIEPLVFIMFSCSIYKISRQLNICKLFIMTSKFVIYQYILYAIVVFQLTFLTDFVGKLSDKKKNQSTKYIHEIEANRRERRKQHNIC